MTMVGFVLLILGFVGVLAMAIILILRLLKRKKPVAQRPPAPSLTNSSSTNNSTSSSEDTVKKFCRSRCWCCLNCVECQQRRPPGFNPFPKKSKRKYTISQRERQRRSRRMKRRWLKDREGMLKKIREGVWRWLLDMEPCGCKCCKECLRCQAEMALKDSGANNLDKDRQQNRRSQSSKKRASKGQNNPLKAQIKSLGSQNKSSKNQCKSPKNRNKSPDLFSGARNPRLKRSKSTKKSSLLDSISRIIKKWKEKILEFLKRLWKQIGQGKVKLLKLSQNVNKTSANESKSARILRFLSEFWRLSGNAKSLFQKFPGKLQTQIGSGKIKSLKLS